MQIIGNTLTSHPWTMAGIVMAVAGAVAGIAAFTDNLVKIREGLEKLRHKNNKPVLVESKRVELKDLGITPFKTATRPIGDSVRDIAVGVALGTVAAEVATHSHHHTPSTSHNDALPHGAPADLPDATDIPSDDGSIVADAHKTIAEHADGLFDWIGDLFS